MGRVDCYDYPDRKDRQNKARQSQRPPGRRHDADADRVFLSPLDQPLGIKGATAREKDGYEEEKKREARRVLKTAGQDRTGQTMRGDLDPRPLCQLWEATRVP